jgi:hypothetical protein
VRDAHPNARSCSGSRSNQGEPDKWKGKPWPEAEFDPARPRPEAVLAIQHWPPDGGIGGAGHAGVIGDGGDHERGTPERKRGSALAAALLQKKKPADVP